MMMINRKLIALLNNVTLMTVIVNKLSILRALIIAFICFIGIHHHFALAAGTPANTSISNTATLQYDVAGFVQANITSPAAVFVVDNKINLTVIEIGDSPTLVTPLQNAAVTTFSVTNNGNATQDYALTGGNVVGAPVLFALPETFNALACNTFVENGVSLGYQAGQDIANFIDELGADGSATVYVVCNIGTQASNDQAVVELTAITHVGGSVGLGTVITQTVGIDNPAAVDLVFADAATVNNSSGTLPAQLARDAIGFARDAYRVASTVVNVIKTATCKLTPSGSSNGANCSQAKTGTEITYQLQINVIGTGNAAGLVITDPLPANLNYQTNTITVNTSPRSDSIDIDNSQFSANTVTVNLGTVTAPAAFTILFKANIN